MPSRAIAGSPTRCARSSTPSSTATPSSRSASSSAAPPSSDWPAGDWGSLPLEGGIEAAYRSQLEQADDPEVARREIEERLEAVRSPFRTAEAFLIEEIVDPRDTRPLLCEFAELAAPLLGSGPSARQMRP